MIDIWYSRRCVEGHKIIVVQWGCKIVLNDNKIVICDMQNDKQAYQRNELDACFFWWQTVTTQPYISVVPKPWDWVS